MQKIKKLLEDYMNCNTYRKSIREYELKICNIINHTNQIANPLA